MRSSRFLYPGIDCSSRESSLRPRVESPFNWNSKNIPVSAGVTSVFVALKPVAEEGSSANIVIVLCSLRKRLATSRVFQQQSLYSKPINDSIVWCVSQPKFQRPIALQLLTIGQIKVISDSSDCCSMVARCASSLCVQIGKVKYSTLIIGVFNAHLASIAPVSIRLPFKGASGSEVFAKF